MPTSGNTYFITNKQSGTALDLSGDDQRSIIGFDLHRGDNQKWRLIQHHDGWTIQNARNKYLDIESNPGDGVKVIAVATNNPRKWEICHEGNNSWRISIQGTNQTVDLAGGNPAPRTPVVIWSRWGGQNQLWKFEQHQDKPDRVFASQCEPRLTRDNQSGMAYPVTFWPK